MTRDHAPVPMGRSAVPDVSVIIPAFNAMPYVAECLDSVVTQTLGRDRMEVIVVDDGSTDGTGVELDRWAAQYPDLFHVVHEPGSGGPATPRNTGLDLARGRFVFFVDADDYLGREALERLVDAADDLDADVVLGRMRGVGGRPVPERMFRENQPDADLFESQVFWTLAPLKLFRRSLLEEHDLRFPTHFPTCSDQPFTALAYLRARRITVLADYDYYFAVWRDDGQHVSESGTVSNRLGAMEWMCELLSREVPDPAKRARLLVRQFQFDLRLAMRGIAKSPYDERKAQLSWVAALIHTHLSPEVAHDLKPGMRVVCELARRELLEETMRAFELEDAGTPYEITVEGDRVFAHLAYFRDPAVPVPDEVYEITDRINVHHTLKSFHCSTGSLRITGNARFGNVAPAPKVEVVLRRRREPSQEFVAAATTTEDHGFEASVNLLTVADGEPLPDGLWNVHLQISQQGISRTPWLRGRGSDELVTDPALTFATVGSGTKWTARAFLTPTGALSLDVGGKEAKVAKAFDGWAVSWAGTDLLVRGTAVLRVEAPLAVAIGNGAADFRTFPVKADGMRLSARVPVAELPEGRWGVHLRVGVVDDHRAVFIPAQPQLPKQSWRTSLGSMSATSIARAQTLTLRVEAAQSRRKRFAGWGRAGRGER